MSLVAVIAVTATVAVSCTKNSGDSNGGGGDGTKTSAAPSDVASANDKGPVGIITEDPSCAPWTPIINTLADVEGKGWLTRDPSIPSGSWTPEVRAQYEAAGKAMRKAADQAVPLAKMTTHRVMRELYAQFIAYSRAYANSLSSYTPAADNLATTGSTAANVITNICAAISSGAAAARASMIPAPKPPTSIAPVGDLSNPEKMLESPDVVCQDLSPTIDQLLQNADFKKWLNTDPQIAVSDWSPDQQALTTIVMAVMSSTADSLEKLAQQSSNPLVQDFLMLGVQYRRTYLGALPTYQANDHDIYSAGQMAPGVVLGACKAVSG
ncbi:Vmc-like lipoprotein signal peptide domain-containing protein [Mycolicibacterium llatzerense]|uniref:Vmc-like lipoprotein signal peptide domain-containing protein n=1 Tax=Mycolicibacterium llatzerense TaxID=280871 RepID=UPI003083F682